jgi:hypothetical protein
MLGQVGACLQNLGLPIKHGRSVCLQVFDKICSIARLTPSAKLPLVNVVNDVGTLRGDTQGIEAHLVHPLF